MWLIRLTWILAPDANVCVENLTESDITDTIYLLSEPDDQLEHVHVKYSQEIVTLTIFTKHATQESAEEQAKRMCRRILASSPSLLGWHIS
jgi:hypothetical protein